MKPVDDNHDDVGALISSAAADVSAPAGLHAHVRAQVGRRRAPRRRAFGLSLAAGGAAAALAAVLVLAVGGSSGSPSLADAATAALRPAGGPAPAAEAEQPAVLNAQIDGIWFPVWKTFGLRPTGQRSDSLDGRHAVTVAYAGPRGAKVGYTIVDTPPLDVPSSARGVTRNGTRLAVWTKDGANVVTWRRAGHTCVLASRSLSPERLLELAAWTNGGALGGYNG